ncbi:MAG TPA: deoxyribodipyrimidine photo-lyase [Gaiella sp.]|uniref:cryptochrome/photolyase family protein n=1 Tax=Gaiella sp. TaxID=2663207 RepID=UPI002D80633D|nr:deoxyribodipyrimidine photo-lyase [Gaiella sp.]HET9287544.1 deoxyribodipyrimidine photo-lyase [Gaiella sp.]
MQSAPATSCVVLLTRDLRVHDHPALDAAVGEAARVVPLFVFDDALLATFGAPNRVAFLLDALADLRHSLASLGGGLVVRRGDTVAETLRVAEATGASRIHLSEDVSAFARSREERLRRAGAERGVSVHAYPGVTVLPPGDLSPGDSGGPYKVFTPYWNRWRATPRRLPLPAPGSIPAVEGVDEGPLPVLGDLTRIRAASNLPEGGEKVARSRLARWLREGLARYAQRRDDLAVAGTSGLSPYLHFGCLSALEVVHRAEAEPGGEAFVRQLCWRDFHHQLLASDPALPMRDFRPRQDRWRDDPDALAAWQEGATGYPVVDAGMRQLLAQGTMHNRARLVTASFLTKHLYLDWRLGAKHFADHLVDGDVANNVGNWQWVAGTGADTRPNRVFNPTRQARRFDPEGAYVRRWVPELEGIDGPDVHEPWLLGHLRPGAYPGPIVDHEEAVRRFREARAG